MAPDSRENPSSTIHGCVALSPLRAQFPHLFINYKAWGRGVWAYAAEPARAKPRSSSAQSPARSGERRLRAFARLVGLGAERGGAGRGGAGGRLARSRRGGSVRSGPLGSEPQNWASGRLFPGKGAEGPGGRWSPARGDIFLITPRLSATGP